MCQNCSQPNSNITLERLLHLELQLHPTRAPEFVIGLNGLLSVLTAPYSGTSVRNAIHAERSILNFPVRLNATNESVNSEKQQL